MNISSHLSLFGLVLGLTSGALLASGSGDLLSDPQMTADVLSLSVQEGGTQGLVIEAGEDFGGFRYIIGGSGSGSFPGTLQDGYRVPLNYDSYSEKLLRGLDLPAYSNFTGYLDAAGHTDAHLTMQGASVPGLVGRIYYHAAVLIDPKSGHIVSATNPVELLLLP